MVTNLTAKASACGCDWTENSNPDGEADHDHRGISCLTLTLGNLGHSDNQTLTSSRMTQMFSVGSPEGLPEDEQNKWLYFTTVDHGSYSVL